MTGPRVLGFIPVYPEWADLALCPQTDPDLFYPEKGGSVREAKQVCARCPVRAECLEYALENDERFGIWGGESERDRRKLKKERTTTTTTTKETTMTTTADDVDDFEICEDCYGSFEPDAVDENGRCPACALAPAPPEPVRIVGRPTLPGWAADAAQLLVATEGHHDPIVRDVRKIAAQSLQALHTAKTQYDRLASSADRAIQTVKTTPKKQTGGKRDPLATTVLMQQHGITPAQVRVWAVENGVPVAARGNPAKSVIEQYLTTTKEI